MSATIVAFSGKTRFLVNRAVSEYVGERKSVSTYGSLQTLIDTPVNIIYNPDKVEISEYESLTSGVYVLVLDGDPKGNTKFGKWINLLGKNHTNFTQSEKSWEAAKSAESFLNQEVRRYSLQWSKEEMPKLLVSRLGTDLGFLAFEVMKAAYHAKQRSSSSISVEDISNTIVDMLDVGLDPLMDALSGGDAKSLARSLYRLRMVSKEDPVFRVTRTIFPTAMKWLSAQGVKEMDPEKASSAMGIHIWVYKNKVAPALRFWNPDRLVALFKLLAQIERHVLDGRVGAWVKLEAGLLRLLTT